MKKSLLLALLILILGSVPAWIRQRHVSSLETAHQKLAVEAGRLGISNETIQGSDLRPTKRQREDQDRRAKGTAAEIIAFSKDLDAARDAGGKTASEFQKRAMEMMATIAELDSEELRLVIDQLRQSGGISEETRGNLVSYAILSLSEKDPRKAADLLVGSEDLLGKSMLVGPAIVSAMSNWAQTDPAAALAWLKNHESSHPDIADDDAKCGVFAGAAAKDPASAFRLLEGANLKDPMTGIHAIVMTAHETPEQREAVMEALRGHLGSLTNEAEREEVRSKALEIFARTSDGEGYESLAGWMEEAKFTPEEKDGFAGGLTYFTTKEDTGKWVDWISKNLPEDAQSGPVRELIGEWTQQDYLAAGKWLAELPDGTAKPAAVAAYAEAVAEYEPQVAVQWAMTMPEGPQRETTMKAIYQNWPAGDPEGAAKFAREHGLE